MPARPLRLLFFCAALSASSATAEDKAAEKIDVTRMTELPVLVTDEDGQPVAGAEVMPYAMLMKEGHGTRLWDQKIYGPLQWHASNDEGVAVIRYPGHVRAGPDILTTETVLFRVTHSDFLRQPVSFNLGPERAEVQLTRGGELRLSAVDPDGNRIEDFGVAMAGPSPPELWVKDGSGGRKTRSICPGTWQTLLVRLQDNAPTLFSDVLPLRVRPQQTVQVRNIRLLPGARVRGRLSPNVRRPVKGYVIAVSYPKPAGNSWDKEDPSVAWHDWVDVADDGTFEFTSLPRGGVLQLIVICDGWISTSTIDNQVGFFIKGQLFDVDSDVVDLNVEMEPTGTLKVEVVTKDGRPVTEGQIGTWPNQLFYKGGGGMLGDRSRSADEIRNQLVPRDQRTPPPTWNSDDRYPYISELNDKGVAVLTGIPIGRQMQFRLTHETLKLGPFQNDVSFKLPSAEPVTVKATAVAAPQ